MNAEIATAVQTAPDQLAEAKARRRQARQVVASLRDALSRAQAAAEAAFAQLSQRLDSDKTVIEANVADHTAYFLDGAKGEPPPVLVEVGNLQDRATAEARSAVLDAAAGTLKDQLERATSELAAAEADVVRAADAQLFAELDIEAIELRRQHSELQARLDRFRACVPDGINAPVHIARRPLSAAILEALDLLPAPDDLRRPVSIINGTAAAIPNNFLERRAALIDDDNNAL